ncbi:MAG TPA: crossover junction endodeoxyribonuclease RuvC, partial [Pseudomonas sp.]|nr:crossover junction endodeoxyribonuclease RuvC [Pseudomonas sp.]
VGTGKAAKPQVQDMQTLLAPGGLEDLTDAADALGVAICHAHSIDTLSLLGTLSPDMQALRMKNSRLVS